MDPRYPQGTGSVVQLFGHPLHPMIVPVVVGMAFGAFVSDCAYFFTERPFYLEVTRLALLVTLIAGGLAALLGAVEFISIPRAKTLGIGWAHVMCNVVALMLVFVNYRVRLQDGLEPIVPYGLLLSTATMVLILAGGWFGGEMSYRHGVGVSRGVGSSSDTPRTGTVDDVGQG